MIRSPMKRSGFKNSELARAVKASEEAVSRPSTLYRLLKPANYAPVAGVPASAIPKEDAIEHEGYRRLVASFDCIHCGKANRSQHAHENEQKGKALKLDDRRAMPLCADEPGMEGCHTKFDQYRLLAGGREAHVAQGRIWARITRAAVEVSGRWPKNLPRWSEA